MKKYVAAVLACLVLSGCGLYAVIYDKDKAVAEANKVVKAFYIDRDFKNAYDMCGDQLKKIATVEDLEKMVLEMEGYVGKVKSLKPISYVPYKDGLIIFYNGINERGVSYHEIVLVGSLSYKVVGIYISDHPEQGKFIEYKKSMVVE